jgi:hypothetical protein
MEKQGKFPSLSYQSLQFFGVFGSYLYAGVKPASATPPMVAARREPKRYILAKLGVDNKSALGQGIEGVDGRNAVWMFP